MTVDSSIPVAANDSIQDMDKSSAYQAVYRFYAKASAIARRLGPPESPAAKIAQAYQDEADQIKLSADRLAKVQLHLSGPSMPKDSPNGATYELGDLDSALSHLRQAYGRLSEIAEQTLDVSGLTDDLAKTVVVPGEIKKQPSFRLYPIDLVLIALILAVVALLAGRFVVAPQIVRSNYDTGVKALETRNFSDAIPAFRYVIANDIDNRFPDKETRLSSAYEGLVKARLDDSAWDQARSVIAEWRTTLPADKSQPVMLLSESYYRPADKAYQAKQWPDTRRLLDQLLAVRAQEGLAAQPYRDTQTYYLNSLGAEAADLIAQKRWTEAQPLLEQLRQRDPNSTVAKDLLLTSYYFQALEGLDAQNWDTARNFVGAGLNSYPATASFIPSSSLGQTNALTLIEIQYESYYRPAVAALNGKQYTDARALFESLLRLKPDAPYKQADVLRLETFYRPAVEAVNGQDWKTAQTGFLVSDLLTYRDNTTGQVGYQKSLDYLRQSFLLPARDLAKAGQWQAIQTALRPYFDAKDTYKLPDVPTDNTGSSPTRELLVLWRDSYYWAGKAAFNAGSFETAAQQFAASPIATIQTYDDRADNPNLDGYNPSTISGLRTPRLWLEFSYMTPAVSALSQRNWTAARQHIDDLNKALAGLSAGGDNGLPVFARYIRLEAFFLPAAEAFQKADWQAARSLLNTPELLDTANQSQPLLEGVSSAALCDLIRSYTLPASTNIENGNYGAARTDVEALLALKIDATRCPLNDYAQASKLLRETYLLPAKTTNDKIAAYDIDTTRSQLDGIVQDLATARDNVEKLLALDPPALPYPGAYDELRRTMYLLANAQLAATNLPQARSALLDLIKVDARNPQPRAFQGAPALITRAFYTPAFELKNQQDWKGIIALLEPLADLSATYKAPGYLDAPTGTVLADAYFQLAVALSQEATQTNDMTKIDQMIALLSKLQALRSDYPGAATLLLQATYAQAKISFDKHDYKSARERLQSLIKARAQGSANPADPQGSIKLADSQEFDPYFRDAATLLREAYYVPAKSAFDKGDWATARAELDALFRVINDSNYKDARSLQLASYYNEALALRDKKQWAAAADVLAQLLKIKFDYRDAPILLNQIRFEAAKDAFDKQDYVTTRALLDALLEQEPLFPGALSLRRDTYIVPAQAAIAQKNWGLARQSLSLLLKQDPGYAQGEYDYRNTFYQEALALYTAEQWAAARQALSQVIQRDRAYPDVQVQNVIIQVDTLYKQTYYMPGKRAFDASDWTAVQNLLRPLVDQTDPLANAGTPGRDFKPDDTQPAALWLVTTSYIKASQAAVGDSKNYALAEQALRDALTLPLTDSDQPGKAEITAQLIDVLKVPAGDALKAEDWGTARQKYQQIIKLDPANAQIWQNFITTYLTPADSALKAQNWGIAHALYDQARQILTPDAPSAVPADLLKQPDFDKLMKAATDGYYMSYYQPAVESLDAEDWVNARERFLLPLYNELDKAAPAPNCQDFHDYQQTLNLLISTYTRPIENAISKGNIEVAKALLKEFHDSDNTHHIVCKLAPNEQDQLDQLGVNLYLQPLQNSLTQGDWQTAAGQFLQLRQQPNVDNMFLDDKPVKYPQLRATLVQANSPYWLSGIQSSATPTPFGTRAKAAFTTMAISTGGTRIITGDINGVVQINGQFGARNSTLTIQTNTAFISGMIVDPNGNWFITTSDESQARVWRVSNGQELRILTGHQAYISSLAVDPAGKYVATGSYDGTVRVWQASSDWSTLPDASVLKMDKTQRVTAVQFSPNGKLLAVATADGLLALWNVETGQQVAQTSEPIPYIRDIEFRPTTQGASDSFEWITIGNEEVIHVWKSDGKSITRTDDLKGHADQAWLRAASFTSDGNILATVGTDNQIILWNMVTGRKSTSLTTQAADLTALRFSQDASQLIAVNQGGEILVWSVPEQK